MGINVGVGDSGRRVESVFIQKRTVLVSQCVSLSSMAPGRKRACITERGCLQVRAFWTILEASFSASRRVWIPVELDAAYGEV